MGAGLEASTRKMARGTGEGAHAAGMFWAEANTSFMEKQCAEVNFCLGDGVAGVLWYFAEIIAEWQNVKRFAITTRCVLQDLLKFRIEGGDLFVIVFLASREHGQSDAEGE